MCSRRNSTHRIVRLLSSWISIVANHDILISVGQLLQHSFHHEAGSKIMAMNRYVYFVACTVLLPYVQAYNILMPVAEMPSHVIYAGRLAERLRHGGHDVTLLLPSNIKIPNDIQQMDINISTFHTPGPPAMEKEEFKAFAHESAFHPSFFTHLKMMDISLRMAKVTAENFFKDSKVLQTIQAANFDFVVVDPALMTYFLIPYKLGIPYAYLIADCMGPLRRIPTMPSCVPNLMTSYSDNMNFKERVINFLLYMGVAFVDFGGYEESRKFVPERPEVGFNELILNASLCLQLRENVIDFIRPEMPDVISVANLMARKAKPLSPDMQSYMDQSKNGVILVSFGTVFTELPSYVILKLFKVWETLNQDVIFKYSRADNLMNVPANVRVMSWVPQNDLLAHPNLKLFITHAGLNSIIETIHNGVPVISFPHGIDQHNNAALAKAKGLGEIMAVHDFTSEQLQQLIVQILTDERYSASAEKLSLVFKDSMTHSAKDPVYWIEHVIKFGDRHLRSHAREMPVYQYLMIDVIAFLVLAISVFTAVVFYICRCIIVRACCQRKKTKVD